MKAEKLRWIQFFLEANRDGNRKRAFWNWIEWLWALLLPVILKVFPIKGFFCRRFSICICIARAPVFVCTEKMRCFAVSTKLKWIKMIEKLFFLTVKIQCTMNRLRLSPFFAMWLMNGEWNTDEFITINMPMDSLIIIIIHGNTHITTLAAEEERILAARSKANKMFLFSYAILNAFCN